MLLFVPLLKDLGEAPGLDYWEKLDSGARISFSLNPSGLKQLKGGCVERSPGQKEEASANFLRRGCAGRAPGMGVGVGVGCPGLLIPPPGPGRGGAGRCPPSAVPFFWPLPSAARAGVSAACGKLVAGAEWTQPPPLTVSPVAHGPSRCP